MSAYGQLIIQIGNQPEETVPLTAEQMTLGRDALNEIVLPDPEVSRRHAQVIVADDGSHLLIEDLGSTNGTFVNGRRVTKPTPVEDGDTVELGQAVTMVYRLPAHDRPTAPFIRPGADVTAPRQAVSPLPVPPVVTEDDEQFYAPSPAAERAVPGAADAGTVRRRPPFAVLVGCGLLLALGLLAATLFFLDAYAPDLLYCGPLQGFWEATLGRFLALIGRTLTCP